MRAAFDLAWAVAGQVPRELNACHAHRGTNAPTPECLLTLAARVSCLWVVSLPAFHVPKVSTAVMKHKPYSRRQLHGFACQGGIANKWVKTRPKLASQLAYICLRYHIGFACPEGTAVPKQLKPGFYRSTIRSSEVLPTSVNAIKLCPEGFYCTGGSKLPVPCLSGYVSGEGSSECLPCPTGYMCKTSRAADVEVRHRFC